MTTTRCVLYSADWCQPCKNFKRKYWPTLKADFPHIQFQIADIEQMAQPDETITSIPTLRIFRGRDQKTFRHPVEDLEEIRDLLGRAAAPPTRIWRPPAAAVRQK